MSPRAFSYAAGVAFAAAGATCWSLGGALQRSTVGIDVWQIIFYRSVTVLIGMGLWLGFSFGRSFLQHAYAAGINAVIAGIAIGTAGLTYVAALFYTTVADAIFMTGIAPFLSAIMGLWILRERVPPITWLAMTFALFGLVLILYSNLYVERGDLAIVGILLALYSSFCFSCYAVLLRWGQKTDMSVAVIWNALFLTVISTAMLLLPTGLRGETGLPAFAIGWWNLGVILVMGLVQLTLGLILFTVGSRSVPAAQLSLIILVEPTLSPLWAWLVASEVPPIWTFVGGAVIVAAIVIQALFSATSERRHAQRNARHPRRGEPAFDRP